MQNVALKIPSRVVKRKHMYTLGADYLNAAGVYLGMFYFFFFYGKLI